VIKIKEGVHYVGAVDWQRRLFDALIPLPEGTSYNSYLVRGAEKTALIDTVDPTREHELVANLKQLGVDRIDYLVANHAEQDHSGLLGRMAERFPGSKIVTNAKCKDLLVDHLLVADDRFLVVKEGETLALGGKTLQFLLAPWVHWPETMFTYLVEDRILFTCDFLGAHLATAEMLVEDIAEFYRPAKRYYAEIMMPFRSNVRKHLERIKAMDVAIVAPSHGPIHLKPQPIIDAYADWSSDRVKNEVVLPYVSMHGSTQKMVDFLVDRLIERGVTVRPYDLVVTDTGELAMALVDAATVVIGSPTVLVGPHPLAAYAAFLANALRPKTRFASIIGSYGWGSKMVETLQAMLPNLKVEVLAPVVAKGHPKEQEFAALTNLADQILAKHKESGIAP
jgi:flavorubredoxin